MDGLTGGIIGALIGMIVIGIVVVFFATKYSREKERKAAVEQWLLDPTKELNRWKLIGKKYTASSFLSYYQSLYGRLNDKDYSGIYIIKNITNNHYYVGQSLKILRRVKSHLTGKGNGDIYADYKYGSQLEITLIEVPSWQLNEVERLLIKDLQSTKHGYNRSKGINV